MEIEGLKDRKNETISFRIVKSINSITCFLYEIT